MKTPELTRRRLLSLGTVAVFVLFCAAVFWYVGRPMLEFVQQPEQFRAWVDGHGLWGRAAFVGMVILQIIVAVIPGEPLEIGAGYAFGAIEGTLLCMLGTLVGGIIVWAMVKKWGMKIIEPFFSKEQIEKVPLLRNPQKLETLTFWLFFIPGTPKDLLTWVSGLTKIRLMRWMAITTVARIPSIVTSTIGGDALGMQNYSMAGWVMAVTVAISAVGLLVWRGYSKKRAAS